MSVNYQSSPAQAESQGPRAETKWRVLYQGEVTPFFSLEAALSYADALAWHQGLVKQFDLEERLIRFVHNETHVAELPEEPAYTNEFEEPLDSEIAI